MLILAGLVVLSLSNALSSLLKYTADPTDKLPAISYWLMGSFARSSYKNLMLSAPLIIFGMVLIRLLIFRLNIMSLLEENRDRFAKMLERAKSTKNSYIVLASKKED